VSYLRELRKKKKITAEKMAEILGISVPYLYDLENGRRRLNQDLLKKLREKFGVSADYILDGRQTVPLPPDAIPVGKLVRIPVYGEIRAGDPAFVRDEIIDWAYIPAEQVKGGDYFYLRVKGDSMEGEKIYEGDYVLVRCQPILEDGHIGVVSIVGESASEYGSEATIKKFYRKGNMVILQPANSKYDPIIVSANDVHIIGEVIKVERWLNGRHI
jgi:repressor LexA